MKNKNYTYNEYVEYYNRQALPMAYKQAVRYEKLAEILIYKVLLASLEKFEDITVSFEEEETIGEILKSWARNEETNFGRNSIRLIPREEGGFNLECKYSLTKITEDIETIAADLFGTLCKEEIGEEIRENDIEIKDFEEQMINQKIERKKIKIPTQTEK